MRTKIGILYCLENVNAWNQYKKCGRTTQLINKRLSNLQTSLLDNCNIIYLTDTLLDCYFYEFLLKKFLKNYRLRTDREFFEIEFDEIKEIYETFNFINTILNTEEKLNEYIKNNYPEYLKKRTYSQMCSSDSSTNKKLKKQTGIYVDTSY